MTKTQYLPNVTAFVRELAETVTAIKGAGADVSVPSALLTKVNDLLSSAAKNLAALESATAKANAIDDAHKKAKAFHDSVFTAQVDLRKDIDALEVLLPRDLWPVPTYQEMLFDL
jgi:glutamine synthetase